MKRFLFALVIAVALPLLAVPIIQTGPRIFVEPSEEVQLSGFDWSCNGEGSTRFRLTDTDMFTPFPATILLKANVKQQNSYHTFFFVADPGDSFSGTGYYGMHPYPNPSPNGANHVWEISIDGQDETGGAVTKSTWFAQASTVEEIASAEIRARYYPDTTDTGTFVEYESQVSDYANTFAANGNALHVGDAPWSQGNEQACAILRGFQIYTEVLSTTHIEALNECETTACVTSYNSANGITSLWWLKMNPTDANDIADDSGAGHDGAWVGSNRPDHWTSAVVELPAVNDEEFEIRALAA